MPVASVGTCEIRGVASCRSGGLRTASPSFPAGKPTCIGAILAGHDEARQRVRPLMRWPFTAAGNIAVGTLRFGRECADNSLRTSRRVGCSGGGGAVGLSVASVAGFVSVPYNGVEKEEGPL